MKRNACLITILVSMMIIQLISSCHKTYSYPAETPADYMPLAVGKYITYRLDSLQFVNFGTRDTVVSYLAQDVVDAAITDNLGRPSFRVIRYLSDTSGAAPWAPTATFLVTPTGHSIEVVDNNMRFIKLVSPIVSGNSWAGNSYIDTRSAFSQFAYLDGWNYNYDSVGMPFATFSQTVPQSVTIHQANDSSGAVADSVYSTRTYSEEVYGKGIGLIYKNFLHWEYQPPNVNVPVGSTTGYGIKLIMVDHN